MNLIKILACINLFSLIVLSASYKTKFHGKFLLNIKESQENGYLFLSHCNTQLFEILIELEPRLSYLSLIRIEPFKFWDSFFKETDLNIISDIISKEIDNNRVGSNINAFEKLFISEPILPKEKINFAKIFISKEKITKGKQDKITKIGQTDIEVSDDDLKNYLNDYFPERTIEVREIFINIYVVEFHFSFQAGITCLQGLIKISINFDLDKSLGFSSPNNSSLTYGNMIDATLRKGNDKSLNKFFNIIFTNESHLLKLILTKKVSVGIYSKDSGEITEMNWIFLPKKFYDSDPANKNKTALVLQCFTNCYDTKSKKFKLSSDHILWMNFSNRWKDNPKSAYEIIDEHFDFGRKINEAKHVLSETLKGESDESIAEGTIENIVEDKTNECIRDITEGSIENIAERAKEGSIGSVAEESCESVAEGSADISEEESNESTSEGSIESISEESIGNIAEGSTESIADGSADMSEEVIIEENTCISPDNSADVTPKKVLEPAAKLDTSENTEQSISEETEETGLEDENANLKEHKGNNQKIYKERNQEDCWEPKTSANITNSTNKASGVYKNMRMEGTPENEFASNAGEEVAKVIEEPVKKDTGDEPNKHPEKSISSLFSTNNQKILFWIFISVLGAVGSGLLGLVVCYLKSNVFLRRK